MFSEFQMYSNIKTRDTYIEVWGGSTKHPDIVKKVVHDNPYFDNPLQDLAQTLLLMGSETLFPFHIDSYIKQAQKVLRVMRETNE